jgi:hypothetical protein
LSRPREVEAEHRLVYADPYAYSAHPHAVTTADGTILCVFNRAPRRSFILHPPQDPYFENVLVKSQDGGLTWSPPSVVPDYGWSGVECAGLTVTRNGRVLLNQWRFNWHPLGLARRLASKMRVEFPAEWVGTLAASTEIDGGRSLLIDPERLAPWARAGGRTFVHISDDGGDSFVHSVEIATAPWSGGYGMRGAVELDDGTLVLPLADIPEYERIFAVRSTDGGGSWGSPVHVAAEPGMLFEEPAPLMLPSGRVLVALRENRRRTIYTVRSDDGGETWSRPEPTGIAGYPAHLLDLGDGRILCTYGYREPPFAIRAVISKDRGASWETAGAIGIREGMRNKNLGYPTTVRSGGGLVTIYYAEDETGVTGIWSSTWSIP